MDRAGGAGQERPGTPALVVVAARIGSTRLPGKVLAEVAGMPLLELQLRRLLPLAQQTDARIVVATTDLAADDAIVELAERLGVAVVRGPEDDVLSRFAIAMVRHPGDPIVRLGADSPLIDPYLVRAAIDLHREAQADYTSNLLPRSYPQGLDVEVLSARALRAAELEAVDPTDREQVTSFAFRRPERFRIANLHAGHALAEERWAVTTQADLDRVREILSVVPDPLTASWNRILAVAGRANKPRPGQIVLNPLDDTPPGTAPWVRTWAVQVDGREVGKVAVAAGGGRAERRVDVPEPWLEPATDALYRLLLHDAQTRT